MKILFVSLRGPTNKPKRGGAQDYIRFIGQYLTQQGHEVVILCGQEVYEGEALPIEEEVDGVEVIRVPTGRSRLISLIRASRSHAKGFDIIVENIMGFPLFLPWFLPVMCRERLFAIKHHFEGRNFLNSQGVLKGCLGIFLEYVLQPLIYRFVRWIAVSEATRVTIERAIVAPRLQVEKIPPGIHHPAVSLSSRASDPTILYFGALDIGRKRVDHLIEAFRTVCARLPSARLLIGGSGPSSQILIDSAHGLNVTFEGFLSEARKLALLESAWLFASPSNSEGFGITWIEANAAGLPVIGYELGLDTVNPDCSIMVEENNVEALAEALLQLLEDKDRREKMGLAAIHNAKRFSWEASGQMLETVVMQDMENSGR